MHVVGQMSGVTMLDGVVYVVFHGQSTIRMYDADTLDQHGGGIEVEGMKSPGDIAACHEERRLYVADCGDECIWRVSAGIHSYLKWIDIGPIQTEDKSVSVSVSARHLFVSCHLAMPIVRQYSKSDGTLLVVVQMPKFVWWVCHAAETTRGTVVVSHKGTSQGKDWHGVSSLLRFCYTCKYDT